MTVRKDEVDLSVQEQKALEALDTHLSKWLIQDTGEKNPREYPIHGFDSLNQISFNAAEILLTDRLKRALISRFKDAHWKVREKDGCLEFS